MRVRPALGLFVDIARSAPNEDLTRTELYRFAERCCEAVMRSITPGIEPSNQDRSVVSETDPMVCAFFERLAGHKGEIGVDPMECAAWGALPSRRARGTRAAG
jgi:hypothetical protein